MKPYNKFERAECWFRDRVGPVKSLWLRAKFACGCWRGVMIHADPNGKLTANVLLQGLHIDPPKDPTFKVVLGDKEILVISPSRGVQAIRPSDKVLH